MGDAVAAFEGSGADRVGQALAAGDVNGDGAEDLVVSATGADGRGAVYVVGDIGDTLATGWALVHDLPDAGRSIAPLGESGVAIGSLQAEANPHGAWFVWDVAAAVGAP